MDSRYAYTQFEFSFLLNGLGRKLLLSNIKLPYKVCHRTFVLGMIALKNLASLIIKAIFFIIYRYCINEK